MPSQAVLDDPERKARYDALRRKYDTENAVNTMQQYANAPMQAVSDMAHTVAGWPSALATVGTGLLAQTGSGLGTAAGVVADTLRNGVGGGVDRSGNPYISVKKPDMDAAAETVGENTERFTAQPKTEDDQMALRGIGAVMEPVDRAINAVSDPIAETYGPGAGAITKGLLNVAGGPEDVAPVVAALKGNRVLQQLIREAGPSRGISSAGRAGKQRGAWVPGDIANEPGDFQLRSPTVEAFTRLKPQEQTKLPGRQLMKALQREGAKKEELTWMGLDKVLDTDEVLSVAEVKNLAATNAPKIEHKQLRAGEGGELDDDAVSEAVSEAVSNDDDLRYPVTLQHRAPGSRRYEAYDQAPGNFDSHDEAMDWLDKHKEELVEHETNYFLENIGEHFDEEQLAEMDDNAKQEWASNAAQSSVEDQLGEFETESDYDSGAINEEELRDYHEQRIRENPADYGLEGSADAPSYGEHTVGNYGSEPESSYTVGTGRLTGESRFGRNMRQPDELRPYMQAELAKTDPDVRATMERDAQYGQQELPLGEADKSKAYQREALRRSQMEQDPNASKYMTENSLSHYRELGKNQMYFTRETARPAPDWGTVKKGVGRVDETGLATPEGELPPSNEDNPLALLEEAQSDWYQKGRKTGWADPKDLAEVEKQKVDKEAQVKAFKQQAVGELDSLWRNPHVEEVIQRALKDGGPGGYLGNLMNEWHGLQPGGALTGSFDTPELLQDRRITTGKRILAELGNYADEYPQAGPLISQTDQGLRMMTDMTHMPEAEDLTATGPMRETPQYTQLAMADALRRAVQEGKQYFAWTPGDVHAHRWGSDSMQFAPSADNPRKVRARFGGGREMEQQPGTVLEKFQERADELLGDDDINHTEYDLDDPNIENQLHEAVEANLNYGMSDYPDPPAAMRKRAALIRKQMEDLSQRMQTEGPLPDEGTVPRRKATHYSPRAFGYEQAYGPMEKHIMDILRRSKVKPPQIRDIPMRGGSRGSELPMRGFEIDPDLARAAKRGFILPY